MPALQHVLVTASDDGSVTLETTDTEVYVRATVRGTVDRPGAVLLNDTMLRPVAHGDDDVLLRADGHVSRGRSRFTIPVIADIHQFPGSEVFRFEPLALAAADLAAALRVIDTSADEESGHFNLRALFVLPGAAMSSDGYQLSRMDLPAYAGPRLAVPIFQAKRLIEALQRDDARVHVAHNDGGVALALKVEAEGFSLTLRLLAFDPPNMQAVLDQQVRALADDGVVLKRQPLLDALRRFMPFCRAEAARGIGHVGLALADGQLVLTDRGGGNVDAVDGAVEAAAADFELALDPARLLGVLGAIDSPRLHLTPPSDTRHGTAARFLPGDGADESVLHLIATIKR